MNPAKVEPLLTAFVPAIVRRVQADLDHQAQRAVDGRPQMARVTPREWFCIVAALREAGAIE